MSTYIDYLQHHGVLGMKWGVRRYQPYPSGHKGGKEVGEAAKSKSSVSQKAKKLLDRDYDARKESDSAYKRYQDKIQKLNTPSNTEWRDKNGKLTEKAKTYLKKTDEYENEWRDAERKAFSDEKKERDALKKSVFFDNKEISRDVSKAKSIKDEINKAYAETISDSSKYAKEAYKQYKERTGGNDDYSFSHYIWREGNAAYDKAFSEYNSRTKDLRSQYDKITESIGRKVCGEFADMKPSSEGFSTYASAGKFEVDQIIQFESDRFKR